MIVPVGSASQVVMGVVISIPGELSKSRETLLPVFTSICCDPALARAAWTPLIDFANTHGSDYEGQNAFSVASIPPRYLWNGWLYRILGRSFVNFDGRPAASWTDFWWRVTSDEVGAFWYAYASAWLPVSLLRPENQARLVDAWLAASRQWPVSFHFNKGLAGAPPAVTSAARNTATNPDVLDAFALALIFSEGPPVFKGFPAPDLATADANRSRVQAAMAALRAALPTPAPTSTSAITSRRTGRGRSGARITRGSWKSSGVTTLTVCSSSTMVSAVKTGARMGLRAWRETHL